MKDRKFGVELEFSSNGLGTYGINNILEVIDADANWDIGRDGSDIELRSPILQGTKGFKELKKVMNALLKEGCSTTTTDGLHIHHDAPEFANSRENTILLVKSWYQNQDAIFKFVKSNRKNSWACGSWGINDIKQLEKDIFHNGGGFYGYYHRKSLNIDSLDDHGTIEIRLHEGTLNYDETEAWIKFGQKFLDSCIIRKNPIPKLSDEDLLLKRIRVARKTELALKEKAKRR